MKCQKGSEQVDASLLDVWGHPRMHTIEMAQGAVGFAGENGNGGVLMPFAVLAAWIVLESAVVGAEEAQLAPAARAGVRAQSGDISGGDHGEVKILSEMIGRRRWRRRARRYTSGKPWSAAFRTSSD